MGKNWKGGRRGKWGGGGSKGNARHDLQSCRGNSIILCTCDVAREREASKELVNLVMEAIECCYPDLPANSEERDVDHPETNNQSCTSIRQGSGTESVQDMLSKELDELRENNRKGKQIVVSVHTGIKGIIVAKITRSTVCPVKLVKSIFRKVEADSLPCSRHLVRMIPLQRVFYPNEEEFNDNLQHLLDAEGVCADVPLKPIVAETALSGTKRIADDNRGNDGCDGLAKKMLKVDGDLVGLPSCIEHKVDEKSHEVIESVNETIEVNATAQSMNDTLTSVGTYMVQFKSRNHNTLKKHTVQRFVRERMPSTMRTNFTEPQHTVIVEALLNIGGISFFTGYSKLLDLNLRKFQQLHTVDRAVVEEGKEVHSESIVVPDPDTPTHG